MKQILVEIDEELAAQLERVAPSRRRQRSEFIRAALRAAIDDILERKTAESYRRHPDSGSEYFDPREWDPRPASKRSRSKR